MEAPVATQLVRVGDAHNDALLDGRIVYTEQQFYNDIHDHHENLVGAIERYGSWHDHRNTRALQREKRLISWRRATDLAYMNPYARGTWRDCIASAIEECDVSDDLWVTTILNESWHFDDTEWKFDGDRVKRQVRNALIGESFLFHIELAPYRNVRGTLGGRLITPHIQGLMWRKLGRGERSKVNGRFAGGLFGADPLWQVPPYDFPGALRYSIKPPFHGYSLIERRDGKRGHCRCNLSLAQHFWLYENLKGFRYPDLAFAGGEGVHVLRRARELSKDP